MVLNILITFESGDMVLRRKMGAATIDATVANKEGMTNDWSIYTCRGQAGRRLNA